MTFRITALSVIMLCLTIIIVMLIIIRLSVIMVIVIRLSVVKLIVMAPLIEPLRVIMLSETILDSEGNIKMISRRKRRKQTGTESTGTEIDT